MPDILSFLAGATRGGLEEWKSQRYMSSQEDKERRREYLRLLMSGHYTEPEAREISGYKGVSGREAEAVESATRRAGEEKRAGEEREIEMAGFKKEPLKYLEHKAYPFEDVQIPDVSGSLGLPPGAIPQPPTLRKRETFPEQVGRRERGVEQAKLERERTKLEEKRTYTEEQAIKTLTRQEAKEKRVAKYTAGLKGEKEKESPRRTKWRATVDAIIRTNAIAASKGEVFEVTPPTWEEYDAKFVEKANPKTQAKQVFNKMKGAGYDKDKMLKKYKENQPSLMADGIDIAHLLELIEAYE